MIPVRVARAVDLFWETSLLLPDDRGGFPLRVFTKLGDKTVFIEAATKCAALKIQYEDALFGDDEFDVLFPQACVRSYQRTANPDDLMYEETQGNPQWPNFDEALRKNRYEEIRRPKRQQIRSVPMITLGMISILSRSLEALFASEDSEKTGVVISTSSDHLSLVNFFVEEDGMSVEFLAMPANPGANS